MKENYPVRVVCAIIIKDGLFLAALRSANRSRGGLWEFPGGKIHSGETAPQALKREIVEELGVEIEVSDQLPPSLWHYPDVTISLAPFIATLTDDGEPVAHEHEKIVWIGRCDAARLSWAPADIPIVDSLCASADRWKIL